MTASEKTIALRLKMRSKNRFPRCAYDVLRFDVVNVVLIRFRHHSVTVVQCRAFLFLVDKIVSMLQNSSNTVNGGDAATHEINPMLKTLQLDEPSDSPDDRMRYNTIGILFIQYIVCIIKKKFASIIYQSQDL